MEKELSLSTKELIVCIEDLYNVPFGELSGGSETMSLEHFPFFCDIDEAFEVLDIKANGSYTPIGGVDSEFSVEFKYKGLRFQVNGSVRWGYAHLAKYEELKKER